MHAHPADRRRCDPLTLAVVATLAVASAADAQRPAMPRVRSEPCQGYCSTTWATCRRVALLQEPAAGAPVVATLDSGQLVRVIDGRRITTSPGVVVVRRTHTLVQRLSGSDEDVKLEHPKRWRLFRGDTVFVVDRDTDGDSYVNYVWTRRAREDTTAAFWRDPEDGPAPDDEVRMIAPMEQTWWARVRTATGLSGWTAAGNEWSGRSHYDDPASKCVAGAPKR